MRGYFIKRILQIIPVLLIISFIVFCLIYLAGDPTDMMLPADAMEADRATMRSALGLDRSFGVQYGIFLSNLARGNLGNSFRYHEPALPIVLERLPATLELTVFAMFLAVLIAIPFGIWSAMARNSLMDILVTGVSVLGRAMPSFWLGIMLILFFAVRSTIFPVSGRGGFEHLILPGFTLAIGIAAQIIPLVRSSLLEILQQDYVRTARSKGLTETIVICKHAFRNALVPVVSIMTVQIPGLLGGALITESVFSWPGLGQLVIQAIYGLDMAIVQAAVLVIAGITICFSLLADFLYCLIDPRIQYK